MDNQYPDTQFGVYDASGTNTSFHGHFRQAHPSYSNDPVEGQSWQFDQFHSAFEHMSIQNAIAAHLSPQPEYGRRDGYAFQDQNFQPRVAPPILVGDPDSGSHGAWSVEAPINLGPNSHNDPEPEGRNRLHGYLGAIATPPPAPIQSPIPRFTTHLLHPGMSSSALGIVLWMNVPHELRGTKRAIADYIENLKRELDCFRSVLNADVKRVICSLCSKEYAPKPSNLERHLHHYFGVKNYKCRLCPQGLFTTKDQAIVHAIRSHGLTRATVGEEIVKLE